MYTILNHFLFGQSA